MAQPYACRETVSGWLMLGGVANKRRQKGVQHCNPNLSKLTAPQNVSDDGVVGVLTAFRLSV